MEIIKTQNLSKVYGKGNTKVEALRDVNISINEGEFVSIVGASGSGKSTLLHLLGGLDRPSSGKVIIDGYDIYNLKEKELAVFRRRKIGFVFQFYNLISVLNVEENIVLPLLLDHQKVDKNHIRDIMNILGIEDRKTHLPSELSGGQQQRVSIGRALAYKPSIILADEPTGNLDSKSTKEVMELLRLSVKKYHQTLVLVTHDLEIASQADRIITLKDGEVVKDEVIR
ncbi:putative ABC transport system ATP-binding protein [Caloranaerobacter azorensis DSM 13643]|uniref:Putative ABC transport system ATP-binding protein n=1 Tax=Caloranaerobacter azorensis DSM 13643 TaxID=1121264 RepID=A0A1M5W5V0_9FIRM|nr:ABC transporter ATP-binding protein [Caloranaerobacter azorensis]SHH82866.1 putative ABC transport system ATP-binding protein [Caloranaerobacter azorensis DSM 13643]